MELTTGPSNVNSCARVPEVAATTRPTRTAAPEKTGTKHDTVVADVQPVLLHESPTDSEAVGVKTTAPNSKPAIVTLIPPLKATFCTTTPVNTGASKVKSDLALPATLPTVNTVTREPPP